MFLTFFAIDIDMFKLTKLFNCTSPVRVGSGTDQKPNLKLDSANVSATSPIVKPPCKTNIKSVFNSLHLEIVFFVSLAFIGIS